MAKVVAKGTEKSRGKGNAKGLAPGRIAPMSREYEVVGARAGKAGRAVVTSPAKTLRVMRAIQMSPFVWSVIGSIPLAAARSRC